MALKVGELLPVAEGAIPDVDEGRVPEQEGEEEHPGGQLPTTRGRLSVTGPRAQREGGEMGGAEARWEWCWGSVCRPRDCKG